MIIYLYEFIHEEMIQYYAIINVINLMKFGHHLSNVFLIRLIGLIIH